MSRLLQWLAALAAGAGVLLSVLAIRRGQLPYDRNGMYFDAEAVVVYHQQSVEVFGLAAVVAILAAGTCWQLARMVRKRVPTSNA